MIKYNGENGIYLGLDKNFVQNFNPGLQKSIPH